MQGIEGAYITFHPEYSAEDDDPLQGIRFVVSTSLGLYPSAWTSKGSSDWLVQTPRLAIL